MFSVVKAEVDVGTNGDHGNTERLDERLSEVVRPDNKVMCV